MRNRMIGALLVLGLSAVGCGGGGGDSDPAPAAAPTPVPAPTLVSIAINPPAPSIDLDAAVALTCLGTYSNGSVVPVSATWTSATPSVASLGSASGAVVTATAHADGTSHVEASVGALAASATVTVAWAIPDALEPVYGADSGMGIVRYAAGGGSPTSVYPPVPSSFGMAQGFGTNAARTTAWAIQGVGSGVLHQVDLATGAGGSVANLPGSTNGYIGLDVDSQGRVVVQEYGAGSVQRYDPATGSLMEVDVIGGGHVGLAIAPDDTMYFMPLYGMGAGSSWINRRDPVTGNLSTWSVAPAAVTSLRNDTQVPGGMMINRKGEAYIVDMTVPDVYRAVDLNGDGDALDAGETLLYGSIPTTGDIFEKYQLGLGVVKGGGAIVNVMPDWGTEYLGLYRLVDRDANGTATGATEVTLYNANCIWAGWPAHISAPR